MRIFATIVAIALSSGLSCPAMTQTAQAAAITIVSGGAFRQVLNAAAAQYRKASGSSVELVYRTVGQHLELIRNGKETFDVAILTPAAIDGLTADGKVMPGSRTDLAKTGIGVVVKAGAPLPDISTVAAFKQTLLAAKSVAYIDPKAGGSSGIYIGRLLECLGIAGAVNAKAVLVHGGSVAAHVANGEAEIGIHQISEILPVAGTVLVGPLPAEIQNFTVYAAGVGAQTHDAAAAKAFVKFLAGSEGAAIARAKGLEPLAP